MPDEKPANNHKKQRRSHQVGIEFAGGQAIGWVFGAGECIRQRLDIKYMSYVDRKKSTKTSKVRYMAWTRGTPPVHSFERGDVFYSPPAGVAAECWSQSLQRIRLAAQVTDALADEIGSPGWVEFSLTRFEHGAAAEVSHHRLTQAGFETFLRTGSLPETPSD